jgi:superfamily II DNA or RNA helicase
VVAVQGKQSPDAAVKASMSLHEIPLKSAYDSEQDDIMSDFYIPVLANSKEYFRLAGFFSSSALAIAARGIAGLISNGGHMKLIVGKKLREMDIQAIQEGTKTREEAIAHDMCADLDSIESEFVRDHVRALAFMIAAGRLQIKVAVLLGNRASDEFKDGIFHQKVGVLSDGEYRVSFSGSVNESKAGWLSNIEEFKVFRSWIPEQEAYLQSDYCKFRKYWTSKSTNAIVIDIPTAVRAKLIDIAPENMSDVNLAKYHRISSRRLWSHQSEAIEAWIRNGFMGIWAMATGSGKTLASLTACRIRDTPAVTVVIVPTRAILDQWVEKEIPQFDPSARVVACCGSNPSWNSELSQELASVRRQSRPDHWLYVVAILNTASTEKFLKAWEGISAQDVQVICDEVHHIGAPKFRRCLRLPSSRRLGLSATPERQWDPIGTDETMSYFGGTIYQYGIERAIRDGHLCHYRYYPLFASLSRDEFLNYVDLSEKISIEIGKMNNAEKEDIKLGETRRLQRLLEKRAMVKKKAEDKIRVFNKALDTNEARPLIIFCEDHEQLEAIQSVLKERGCGYLTYTSRMTNWERSKALETFELGQPNLLLAIRCLDEGIDIPECKGSIIVASSSSEREFIQRRGRILRGMGEKLAVLTDILVLPTTELANHEMRFAENLVRQELRRVRILSRASDNEWECRNSIRDRLEVFGFESLADT